jgi:hypothetical protein
MERFMDCLPFDRVCLEDWEEVRERSEWGTMAGGSGDRKASEGDAAFLTGEKVGRFRGRAGALRGRPPEERQA